MDKKRVKELHKIINSLNNDDLFFIIGEVSNRIIVRDETDGIYKDVESVYTLGTNIVIEIGEN